MKGDLYDHHAPDFVPNEYNSLLLTEADGQTWGATRQKTSAEAIMAEIRERVPEAGDTDIVMYDGDLYIVGDYIRYLMSDDFNGELLDALYKGWKEANGELSFEQFVRQAETAEFVQGLGV